MTVRVCVLASMLCVAIACSGRGSREPRVGALATSDACPAAASWVTSPSPPTEIGGPNVPVGDETFCQFYQFAEQWFLSLVSPSSTPGSRVFETFNIVGASGKTSCGTGALLTGKDALKKHLFARVNKPRTADFDPTLPPNVNQATDQAMYDQNGNLVLYAMLYNPAECQATSAGFVPNTIEVKTSWKQLAKPDPTYYMMDANIDFGAGPVPVQLGLVGFHLAINTALHPEFIWVTYEHKTNDPSCNGATPAPLGGWSFTSGAAAKCLASGGINACGSYNFNQGAAAGSGNGSGTPTQTCRSYPDGTDAVPPDVGPNGNRNALNIFTIDTLNDQLVGPKGILTQLSSTDPMAVFANYTLQGAIWTNGGAASITANQRGSLELANTTMETFVQSVPPTPNTLNCFGCHQFDPTTPLDVSHIYQAAPGAAAAVKRHAK